jgi:hypothetical protein
MPLIHKQLALAITLAFAAISTQQAQARGGIEPDSEWLEPAPVNGGKQYVEPALPAPEDFYFANTATSRNGLWRQCWRRTNCTNGKKTYLSNTAST